MTARSTEPFRQRMHFEFEGARIPVHVVLPASPPRLTVIMLGGIWSVTPHPVSYTHLTLPTSDLV